jgi:hypothetical protein
VLYAETRWSDGTLDDVNIETLQPPEWLAAHQARIGSTVLPPLDLLEMGLPKTMRAEVLAVEPCPPIASGPGRVVLTTINHLNRDVCELTIEDSDGCRETVHPTSLHRFYRETDGQWLHLNELREGDIIHGRDGSLKIAAIGQVPGVHRVFNMTVEGEHLYQVSALGAFAHNESCAPRNIPAGAAGSAEHKAAAWKAYQERGGEWSYERWSNVYEQNMIQAREANKIADAYQSTLGWGKREVTVDAGGQARRLDIADVATKRGVEVKSGYTTLDAEIRSEIARDKILVEQGWDIQWRFEGKASKPLLEELKNAGIKYSGGE